MWVKCISFYRHELFAVALLWWSVVSLWFVRITFEMRSPLNIFYINVIWATHCINTDRKFVYCVMLLLLLRFVFFTAEYELCAWFRFFHTLFVDFIRCRIAYISLLLVIICQANTQQRPSTCVWIALDFVYHPKKQNAHHKSQTLYSQNPIHYILCIKSARASHTMHPDSAKTLSIDLPICDRKKVAGEI